MQKILRLYLDNCCFNRPYDVQSHETIRLESLAKLFIQDHIRAGQLHLVWSFILDFENAANPYPNQRESIHEWKHLATENVYALESIHTRANMLGKSLAIKAKDALHLACALHSQCEYLLTTDRIFIKRTSELNEILVLNPLDFIQRMEVFYEE